MAEHTTPLKNVAVDKSAFDSLLSRLIASPLIRKDDLKPKRRTWAEKEGGFQMNTDWLVMNAGKIVGILIFISVMCVS